MLFILFWIIFLFSPGFVLADSSGLSLCKFKSFGTDDKIEICNNSSQSVNLLNFYVSDNKEGDPNIRYLQGSIPANSSCTVNFSNYLDNNGDTIYLKKIDTTIPIDSVSYCIGCSDATVDTSVDKCGYYDTNNNKWDATSIMCGYFASVVCTTSTSQITPSAAPSPTNSVTPTSPTSPTNTPQPTPTTKSDPSIRINSFPSQVHVEQSFSFSFTMENLSPDTDYTVKAVGGINDVESLETYNSLKWYGYRDAWSSMPKFRSNNEGKISNSISMRVKAGMAVGDYKVQLKVNELDGKLSDIKYVTVKAKLPTITNTPEPTPTDEPEPTETPVEEQEESDELYTLTSATSPDVLGDSTVNTPTPSSSKKSPSTVPILFMMAGGLLLVVPLVISKFNHG